jgi:hypothetical protein
LTQKTRALRDAVSAERVQACFEWDTKRGE